MDYLQDSPTFRPHPLSVFGRVLRQRRENRVELRFQGDINVFHRNWQAKVY